MDVDAVLGGLYELIAPHLTERQRRLLAGAAARALGRGGGARMARVSGLSRPTVYAGVRELDEPPDPRGRIRRPGGGPGRLVERQPGLLQALDELVDPDTRGDPESPLRWTCKSTRQLADAPVAQGFQVFDAFAVATLRRWWQQAGRALYPNADQLLLTADAGGSNGYRVRAWKIELIAATTTRPGLKVRAELDRASYPLGVKASDRDLAAVPLRRHGWHGEWNYTVLPTAA